jgi:hypothetical protein
MLMSSGSKKGTQIYFSFSLKRLRQTNPLQVSQRGPYGESNPFTGPFCISLESLIKISPNKNIFLSLKGPKQRASLHVPPKRGSYGYKRPFSESFLTYLSGSPVKEPSFHVSLIQLPHTEMLRCQRPPSFIFQSSRYTNPLPGFPAHLHW